MLERHRLFLDALKLSFLDESVTFGWAVAIRVLRMLLRHRKVSGVARIRIRSLELAAVLLSSRFDNA